MTDASKSIECPIPAQPRVPRRWLASTLLALLVGLPLHAGHADPGRERPPASDGIGPRGGDAPSLRPGQGEADREQRELESDDEESLRARPMPDMGGGCPYRGRQLELIV